MPIYENSFLFTRHHLENMCTAECLSSSLTMKWRWIQNTCSVGCLARPSLAGLKGLYKNNSQDATLDRLSAQAAGCSRPLNKTRTLTVLQQGSVNGTNEQSPATFELVACAATIWGSYSNEDPVWNRNSWLEWCTCRNCDFGLWPAFRTFRSGMGQKAVSNSPMTVAHAALPFQRATVSYRACGNWPTFVF